MGYFVYKYIRSNGLVQSYYYDKIINLAIIGVIGIVISLPTFQTIYILELEPIKDIETQFYPTKEEIQE